MSDAAQIILVVVGTGITLLGIQTGLLVSLFRILRQDVDSRHKDLRQDLAELRQEMRADFASLNARIDNLYQALLQPQGPRRVRRPRGCLGAVSRGS